MFIVLNLPGNIHLPEGNRTPEKYVDNKNVETYKQKKFSTRINSQLIT